MAQTARATLAAVKGLPEPARIGMVPLVQIVRDPRVNTREIDENWVNARVKRFTEAGMKTLAVAHRADGTYVVLDGQHRAALKRAAGFASGDVKCEIWEGLTLAQEAELFGLLNDSRALTPIHRFLARLTEGDPVAAEVAAITDRCSFKISESPGPGVIRCVSTLERIHKNDKSAKKGDKPKDLERALTCIAKAWGHSNGTSDRVLIGGLGTIFNAFEESIDSDNLILRLTQRDGGAYKLISDAKGLQSFRGGSAENCVAEIVVDLYNENRRSRKLPKWRQ